MVRIYRWKITKYKQYRNICQKNYTWAKSLNFASVPSGTQKETAEDGCQKCSGNSVAFRSLLICALQLYWKQTIYKDFRLFFLYRIPLGVICLVRTEKFPKDSWNFEEIIQKEHWKSPLIIKVTQPYQKPTPAQKYFEILLRFSQKFFFRELLYGRNRVDK